MKINKLTSILLSTVIAFGLWLYVFSNVSQEDNVTFYNIPVVIKGETALMNEQNLMVTGISAQTVSLRLSGSRIDLNKINAGNIIVSVDLSDIYDAGENIAMDYNVSFSGDVPNNAFVVESKSPSKIYVDVDVRRTKEVPVKLEFVGTRSENYLYDMENATLDYTSVTVAGPAAVADQIESAVVEVDLTGRVESIGESFRYALCDGNGEPVDAETIVTNVEEIRLDMPIQRLKDINLVADIIYGGGATAENTTVTIEPATIRVSGGEALLNELGDSLTICSLNLAEIDRGNSEQTFAINLPEGVVNQTGVTEAKVTVKFSGLKSREFTITDIESLNVPEGMTAEIISTSLTVKVRGPAAEIDRLTVNDIFATVDFSGAAAGTATYRAAITFSEDFPNVGVVKSVSVSATVQAAGG